MKPRSVKPTALLLLVGTLFGVSGSCLPDNYLSTLFADSISLVVNSVITALVDGLLASM